ncbi:hypothetical protein MAR_004764 [Mya arenaria]|uniref:Uncharacterized protein n=1 Tax=Mya arenaria TaxID=6604 RepID=A0ABY7F1M5_MYAAR|nr:hypothetical protein MAR_004764 [Mya arenaria]
MASKLLVALLVCTLLAVSITSVEGICYQYHCARQCHHRRPFYDEYAFKYLWPHVCGKVAVERFNMKACCRTFGRY